MPSIPQRRLRGCLRFVIMFEPSGCSAVWLAHLLWEQRVAGSNPVTPTKRRECHFGALFFFVTGFEPPGRSVEKTVLRTVFSDGSCGSNSGRFREAKTRRILSPRPSKKEHHLVLFFRWFRSPVPGRRRSRSRSSGCRPSTRLRGDGRACPSSAASCPERTRPTGPRSRRGSPAFRPSSG